MESDKGSLYVALPVQKLCKSGWPQTLRAPPASISQVLRLKASALMPG